MEKIYGIDSIVIASLKDHIVISKKYEKEYYSNKAIPIEINSDADMLDTCELVIGRYVNELRRLIDLPSINPSIGLLPRSIILRFI